MAGWNDGGWNAQRNNQPMPPPPGSVAHGGMASAAAHQCRADAGLAQQQQPAAYTQYAQLQHAPGAPPRHASHAPQPAVTEEERARAWEEYFRRNPSDPRAASFLRGRSSVDPESTS